MSYEPGYARTLLTVPRDTPEAIAERALERVRRLARIKQNIRLAPSRSFYAIQYDEAAR